MTILRCLSFVVFLAGSNVVLAPVAQAADAADAAAQKEDVLLVTLDFPGGTLDEFFAALEAAYGKPVSLVMPEHSDMPVPAIRVVDVSLNQIFSAIGRTENRINIQEVRTGPASGPVWAVTLASRSNEFQLARTYAVERLLQRFNIGDLTTAIKTAWAMARSAQDVSAPGTLSPEPELKFHQETQLLIVRGTVNDLKLAENVIEQLSPPTDPPKRSPEELAALQANRLDMEAERLSLQADLDQLNKVNPDDPRIQSMAARLQAVEARIRSLGVAASTQRN